jgi:hypothetical protein
MRSLSRKFGRRVIPILFVSEGVGLVHMLIFRTKRDAEYRTPSSFFFLTALPVCSLSALADFSCLTGRCAPSKTLYFSSSQSRLFKMSGMCVHRWAFYFRKVKQIAASV